MAIMNVASWGSAEAMTMSSLLKLRWQKRGEWLGMSEEDMSTPYQAQATTPLKDKDRMSYETTEGYACNFTVAGVHVVCSVQRQRALINP